MVRRLTLAINLTVILVVILLLVLAAGCSKTPSVTPAPKDVPEKTSKIMVFYPTDVDLIGEEHIIPTVKNMPKAALEELFKGQPIAKGIPVLFPRTVRVLDVKVKGNTATINFSREILDLKAPKNVQVIAVAGIVSTVTQFPNIKQAIFNVEGKEKGKIGGKDIGRFWGDVTLDKQPWKM